MEDIHAAGKPKDFTKALGHDSSEAYFFRCPVCEKQCQCYLHRPKDAVTPVTGAAAKSTANLEAFAKEAGLQPSEVAGMMNDTPTRNKGKAKEKEPVKEKEKGAPKLEPAKKKAKAKVKEETKAKAETKEPKKATTKEPKKAAAKKEEAKAKKEVVKPDSTLKLAAVSGPVPPVIKKPKNVEDPNFEFLAISHPLPVIELRL